MRKLAIQLNYPYSMEDLFDLALKNEHSEFSYIRSWQEYRVLKRLKKFFKCVIKNFRQVFKAVQKDYNQNKTNLASLESLANLAAISGFKKCITFYTDEVNLLKSELAEFRSYLNAGNYFKCILGKVRTQDELFNYKEAPIASIEDEQYFT